MRLATEILARPFDLRGDRPRDDLRAGLGIDPREILGFRTPFLAYTDATLTAAQAEGFTYDCSLEEGGERGADGRDYVWPYPLDRGSPGNPAVRPHPGLWEIPVYELIAPPDEACARYGVAPGLRGRLRARQSDFEVAAGKIAGLDWNLWCEFDMSPQELLATIEYSLDQRLAGNRAPLTIGLHSALYSDRWGAGPECANTPAQRRAALEELVAYLQRKDEVRIVSARELLRWVQAAGSR